MFNNGLLIYDLLNFFDPQSSNHGFPGNHICFDSSIIFLLNSFQIAVKLVFMNTLPGDHQTAKIFEKFLLLHFGKNFLHHMPFPSRSRASLATSSSWFLNSFHIKHD